MEELTTVHQKIKDLKYYKVFFENLSKDYTTITSFENVYHVNKTISSHDEWMDTTL